MSGAAVACGHEATTAAAVEILQDGGNAIDAAIAAHFAACVAEPVLASLGGGGFALAERPGGLPVLFDFFPQTPHKPGSEASVNAIEADFGTARQTFHIGMGTVATPGSVAGIAALQQWGGSLPLARLVEPACRLAREGLIINDFQGYILDIVRPIYEASSAIASRYGRDVAATGRRLFQRTLADSLELIAGEGAGAFYRGPIGAALVAGCQELGGHLTAHDLASYRCLRREPLTFRYRDVKIVTNPPPSAGGLLIQYALGLLQNVQFPAGSWGSRHHLGLLSDVMRRTDTVRDQVLSAGIPSEAELAVARAEISAHQVSRGTTHISIIDGNGCRVAMTLSNGEGCGHLIPGTGIILNNMLGEEDINPGGIGAWHPDIRLGSMMAPTILDDRHGNSWVLGSGGSNRIRSAIVQVIVNLLDFHLRPAAAVNAPRIHVENGQVSLEAGYAEDTVRALAQDYTLNLWPEPNLFFGGVHLVARWQSEIAGFGDPRRGGTARVLA